MFCETFAYDAANRLTSTGKKRPPCRNQDKQTARTFDVPSADGSKKEDRRCRLELRTISLVGLITVAPYWYIRGVTRTPPDQGLVIRESPRIEKGP
jgi:hypothetical protein